MSAEDQTIDNQSVAVGDGGDTDKSESRPASTPVKRAGASRLSVLGVGLLAVAALVLALWPIINEEDAELPFDRFQAQLERAQEQHQTASDERAAMQAELDQLARSLTALERKLQELSSELEATAAARDGLSGRLDQFERGLAGLESELGEQLQALWQQEGQIREADRELERFMRLLEAASLLRLGQERAELAADWTGARLAYERAERLLRDVDDPRLGQVRRLLARELADLESLRSPEWERLQARLARLADQLGEWPLRTMNAETESPADALEPAGWRQDAGRALARLVTVRRRDHIELGDDAIDSLREQLRLRLLAAELALVRRDLADLEHQLERGLDLLESWFDTNDPDVAQGKSALQALREVSAPSAPTGLGAALAALSEYLDAP